MFVILVVSSVVLVAALLNSRRSRPNDDSISRHQRALEALREAEQQHRSAGFEQMPVPTLTDHIHILDEAPANGSRAGARARPSTRRPPRPPAGRRRNAAEIAARPTIAHLPTLGPLPTVWLSAPPAEPALVELVPPPITDDPPRRRNRSTARLASGLALVAVLAVAAGAAAMAATDHGSPHRITTPRRTSRPSSPASRTRRRATTPTPSSTVVAHPVPAVAADGTVTVTAPYTLTFAPTGPCWVSVRADTGQTLFEGTLYAGQRQQVAGSGSLVIRLGNTPAMNLLLNGTQLDLTGVARTANVHFVRT